MKLQAVTVRGIVWKPLFVSSLVLGIAGCGALLGVDFDDAEPAADPRGPGAGDGAVLDGPASALCDGGVCTPACEVGKVPCGSSCCAADGSAADVVDQRLTGGNAFTCRILTGGAVTCWGLADKGRTAPPAGSFLQISAKEDFGCGLREDRTITCWGYNPDGRGTASPGAYRQVSAGVGHSCGLHVDGTADCWGPIRPDLTFPPSGSFLQLDSGYDYTCGVRTDQTLECWGDPRDAGAPPSGTFLQVSLTSGSTGTGACAIRTDGGLQCWGSAGSAPTGTFKKIASGSETTCGLRTDGQVACWGGRNLHGETNAPSGAYVDLGVGLNQACAQRASGSVTCWGQNAYGEAPAVAP